MIKDLEKGPKSFEYKNVMYQWVIVLNRNCFSGTTLEIVTDRSQEGSQFVRGFGGIGGKD